MNNIVIVIISNITPPTEFVILRFLSTVFFFATHTMLYLQFATLLSRLGCCLTSWNLDTASQWVGDQEKKGDGRCVFKR